MPFRLVQVTLHVPAVVAGQLIRVIGHQGHLRRTHIGYQRQELLRGISLYIELRTYQALQFIHVLLANMPLIRTRMYRNTLCTKLFAVLCKQFYVGQFTSARVAQSSHLVDVYAKLRHSKIDFTLQNYKNILICANFFVLLHPNLI